MRRLSMILALPLTLLATAGWAQQPEELDIQRPATVDNPYSVSPVIPAEPAIPTELDRPAAVPAGMQQPIVPDAEIQSQPRIALAPAPVPTTENMWFYDQAQRSYHNPKEMVRRNAEHEAVQRRNRIAAGEWFGYSNSRPSVNPNPTHTSFSGWLTSTHHPYQWQGMGRSLIIYTARQPTGSAYGLW